MSDVGHNSASVAREQLRAIVERIERLEEEIAAMNGDKRDVYAEAKANGFDTKVLKKIIADRRKDTAERSEFEAVYHLYAVALGMAPADDFTTGTVVATRAQVHAHTHEADANTAFPAPQPPMGDGERPSSPDPAAQKAEFPSAEQVGHAQNISAENRDDRMQADAGSVPQAGNEAGSVASAPPAIANNSDDFPDIPAFLRRVK